MKTFLLVIKDFLEYKLIVNEEILPRLLRKFDVTIMCPSNKDEVFKRELLSKYNNLKFLNTWPIESISFWDKLGYWLRNEVYFVSRATVSTSCLQKSYLNLYHLFNTFDRSKDWYPSFIKLFRIFFNSEILEKLLKIAVIGARILLTPFEILSVLRKRNLSKVNSEVNFDYILFARPDSAMNMFIYSSFRHKNTKIITVCRNFDTPALRGEFAVPSDYTVVFDKFLAQHLISLSRSSSYGTIMLYEHPIKFYKNTEKNTDNLDKNFKIMYATTAPHIIPDEPEIAKKLYGFFKTKFAEKVDFVIRIYGTDDEKRYQDLSRQKNVFLDTNFFTKFNTYYGKKLPFPTPKQVYEFYNNLQEFDLVLSSGSTINYEAHLLGVNAAYCNLGGSLNWLFKRDHLKILTENVGIPLIKDISDLEKLLLKTMKR